MPEKFRVLVIHEPLIPRRFRSILLSIHLLIEAGIPQIPVLLQRHRLP